MTERIPECSKWQLHDYRAPGVAPLVSQQRWGSFDGLLELSSLRRPSSSRGYPVEDDEQRVWNAYKAGEAIHFLSAQVLQMENLL